MEQLRTRLEDAGWDALVGEVGLAARLEQPPGPGIWTLTVDRAGRFRLTATWPDDKPVSVQLNDEGIQYHLLWEKQQMASLSGKLESEVDLGRALDRWPQIVTAIIESHREATEE